MKYIAAIVLLVATVVGAYAQRPRTVEVDEKETATPAPPPAPQTFKARYEGGVVGYTKKLDGTLTFDDTNERLLFRDKEQKEVLFVPYAAISAAYPDTKSLQPTAATVASSVPTPYGLNFPARFIKKKSRYLTLNFEDPDTNVSGVTSFKVENKEILASILNTLAAKSNLTPRGEGYVKKKTTAQSTTQEP